MVKSVSKGGLKGPRAARPGSLTKAFRGRPGGLHHVHPSLNDFDADDRVDETDGLILVIGHDGGIWRFVMTATGKLGWVCAYDLGVSGIPGTVYSIR